jgi:hypothetical protein
LGWACGRPGVGRWVSGRVGCPCACQLVSKYEALHRGYIRYSRRRTKCSAAPGEQFQRAITANAR